MRLTSLALTVLLALPAAAGDEGPFVDATFEEASKTAAEREVVVFVDFYTTWCKPCKMLDQSTWKDPEVVKWLGENTVALKIDAEKEVDLARKYAVRSYPTLLFTKADGTELDRIVGYADAKRFLEEAKGIASGRTALERLADRAESSPDNPMLRVELAAELKKLERFDEAADHLLWCLEKGTEADPDFAQMLDVGVVGSLRSLAKKHEPTRAKLTSKRGLTEAKLFAGDSIDDSVRMLDLYSRSLGEKKHCLGVFDRLAPEGPQLEGRRALGRVIAEQLIEEQRYQEAGESLGDVPAWFESAVAEYEKKLAEVRKQAFAGGPDPAVVLRGPVNKRGVMAYELALGMGNTQAAAKILDRLFTFEPTYSTLRRLVKAALRVDADAAALALVDRSKPFVNDKYAEKLEKLVKKLRVNAQ